MRIKHFPLTGEQLDELNAGYAAAREQAPHLSNFMLDDVLASYTAKRNETDPDTDDWWALHGAIRGMRDELRSR